ncbi:thermonuclease family protein [Agrobacterium sp. AGB01]|uniref:thermonuclease family protein n=1 Tax=Agrobacterium sp. AGB01 TaxID=2769302 RepID=UPI0017866B98|nr:thermonuclease family protein [Agrobacterium sp. AGB01]MBD9390157.1 thermonuclease family protein [Agrobacterium sp. AGB01]
MNKILLACFALSLLFAANAFAANFPICGSGKRSNCVVDGDTFWMGRTKVRVADIDAPEIGGAKCASEKALGVKAQRRLSELLRAGGFELRPFGNRKKDKYGRDLFVVIRQGASLGDQLVKEGLARTWSGRRMPWC